MRARNTSRQVTCGFVPLFDCAPLIIAHEIGFAEEEGVDLDLVREASWSNIRDKLAVGMLDAAHALAPMPIAMSLGLSRMPADMVAPMTLSINGNLIGIARRLCGSAGMGEAHTSGDARAVARSLHALGSPVPLRIGVPWTFSCHAMLIDYWLSRSGFDPTRDYHLVVVPPPQMADALAHDEIDLFCVGEPWGSLAIETGSACLLMSTAAIWQFAPEKVLALRRSLVDKRGDVIEALVRALYRSAAWVARPDNADTLTEILSRSHYIGQPAHLLEPALTGRFFTGRAAEHVQVQHAWVGFEAAATFPWRSHAQWIASQIAPPGTNVADFCRTAADVYRPDLYRKALSPLGVPLPSASSKIEGALATTTDLPSVQGSIQFGPDAFFDGAMFEPFDEAVA